MAHDLHGDLLLLGTAERLAESLDRVPKIVRMHTALVLSVAFFADGPHRVMVDEKDRERRGPSKL